MLNQLRNLLINCLWISQQTLLHYFCKRLWKLKVYKENIFIRIAVQDILKRLLKFDETVLVFSQDSLRSSITRYLSVESSFA